MTLAPIRPPQPAGLKNGRYAWTRDGIPVVILRSEWDVYDYGARHGQNATTNAGYIQEAIDDAVAAGAGRVVLPTDPDVAGETIYDVTQLTVDDPNVTLAGPARGAVQLRSSTADLLRLGVTTNPYYFHLEGLILVSAVGGGHVIACADSLSQSSFDRIELRQQNAAKSLYYHVGEDYLDNTWTRYNVAMPDTATISPAVEGVYYGVVDYNGSPDQSFAVDETVVADIVAEVTAATITTVDPVSSAGDVTLYQSDHYDADESRALEWSTTSAGTWPTLTGATIAFVARHTTQTARTISVAGSVVVGTGATKQVRVELVPADTNSKPSGAYTYQLVATLSNGHVVTLAAGDLTLTERLRA